MTNFIFIQQFSQEGKIIFYVVVLIAFVFMIGFILKMVELAYVIRYRKPFYVFTPFFLKKLSSSQKEILQNEFRFYKKLSPKHKKYFEHRVASFIKNKRFVGREELEVTDSMKVLISATGVMLTFGFRDFYIQLIDHILIYPEKFYSAANDSFHKGEFNPKMKTLLLSWKGFKEGYADNTDKINLGIHEFAHAIHFNSFHKKDVSSTIFSDSLKELTALLATEENLRTRLIESNYFRNYAYSNQYEFLAVIIESFIESPSEFRSQFPQIYDKTKQMLNFNFAGY